ncbi:MAG: P-II family nitrogen regulator [Pseudomonadota bacterium]
MEHHKAKKIVIITEKLIVDKVTKLIEQCGATGYTITAAGGKGSRGVRSARGGPSDAFNNVKIEVITASDQQANDIADKLAEKYFKNYSGITYLVDVEILRPQKF